MDAPVGRREEEIGRLADLLARIPVAMLTTVDEHGHLRARPMQATGGRFEGKLYFFTNEGAPKVDEAKGGSPVGVVYSDFEAQRYVSVSGQSTFSKDHELMASHWNDRLRPWFPKGLQDPDLLLMVIDVIHAEYWDTPPSLAVDAWTHMKSAVTGQSYRDPSHGTVELR